MKRTPLVNRRVIFKLHGMEPLDATVLKQDETGYWIRSSGLAGQLDKGLLYDIFGRIAPLTGI